MVRPFRRKVELLQKQGKLLSFLKGFRWLVFHCFFVSRSLHWYYLGFSGVGFILAWHPDSHTFSSRYSQVESITNPSFFSCISVERVGR